MSVAFDIDQISQHFIVLTSNQIKKAFNSEESEKILSLFTKRFDELFTKLKEKTDEIQIFHGINPILVIALEESLPYTSKSKKQVTEHVLAIYKAMLEDFVLEPQRRFMTSSKDPWVTFIEDTRKGNQKTYDNKYFELQEISATKEEFAFDINRCIYQEIFKEFGRQDLGSIMCEYDTIIAENVAKWVRFEREETIVEGFPRCTFRFFPIKQKFSDNPIIHNIYSLLNIIDDSYEMLTKQELIERGLDAETDLSEIIKLIETIQNHPGIKTSTDEEEEPLFGNISSYERYQEWKLLFIRKTPLEDRNKIIRNLPLELKEEKIDQLITQILENPYELTSIKWLCLNYLQHHFSSKVGFESEGVDETPINYILEEFSKNYSDIFFQSRSIPPESGSDVRVSIQVYGKGVPEYKLNEIAQLIRRRMVIDFPDASLSAIKPILSIDRVAKKFFDILEDPHQPFQLRELALRILMSRIGDKLIPTLKTISENKMDDPFLRGRAIDSLSWFTSNIPQLFENEDEPLESFEGLPAPIQRSVIDFFTRQGVEEELLLSIANDEKIAVTLRKIALRNLGTYTDPMVTDSLIELTNQRAANELLRQAALEALGKHETKSKIAKSVFEIFINLDESSFIRMEAFETLKDLNYTPSEESLQIDSSDWITTFGLKLLLEG
ncbi:MAG: L-2-amino-thiazoline-4-carboxylic acid hydrolase [Candidatus Thorarchaeota archaeon]